MKSSYLGYTSGIDGATSIVRVEHCEGLRVEQLGGTIARGCDKCELVLVKGHLVNNLGVVAVLLHEVEGVGVVHTDGPVGTGGDNGLVQRSPHGMCDLHVLHHNLLWISCC